MSPALFGSGYFGERFQFFAQAGLNLYPPNFMLPTVTGITGTRHHIQLLVKMKSRKLFARACLKLQSS
jgi:hypothetical protein